MTENSNNINKSDVVNNTNENNLSVKKGRVIDESEYTVVTQKAAAPTFVGKGGDPFFRETIATKEQISELMKQTEDVQNWLNREEANNVAISCLDNENLKEVYFEIKDGFISQNVEYGKIALMGFKTPSGVEIPRLKIFDTNGEVLEVLTGPLALDELNKRAIAFRESMQNYTGSESLEESNTIQDYDGNNV